MANSIKIRKQAVDVHDHDAQWFEQQYDSNPKNRNPAFLYGRKQIDQLLETGVIRNLKPQSDLLDVGCGTGVYVEALRKRGFNAIGIEPSSKMREFAHSRLSRKIVQDGSILNLPFSENSFDAVLNIEVLRYLSEDDHHLALKECYRVLKPGGYLFATFVNRWALDGFWLLVKARKIFCNSRNKGNTYSRE